MVTSTKNNCKLNIYIFFNILSNFLFITKYFSFKIMVLIKILSLFEILILIIFY